MFVLNKLSESESESESESKLYSFNRLCTS